MRTLGRGNQGPCRFQWHIWVFIDASTPYRLATPHASVAGRESAILVFDPSGKLLKSFGVGLFAYPHGFTLDRDGTYGQ